MYDEALLPYNASFDRKTQISVQELMNCLQMLPSKHVLIITDASYWEKTKWQERRFLMNRGWGRLARPRQSLGDLSMIGANVMRFADWNEIAKDRVYGGKRYGTFTYYLVEGIRKKAADRNGDGFISANEWFRYARLMTTQTSSFQHPRMDRGENPDIQVVALRDVV